MFSATDSLTRVGTVRIIVPPRGPAPASSACGRISEVGAWRSLVAHLLWEQRVGGSNPSAPTTLKPHIYAVFSYPAYSGYGDASIFSNIGQPSSVGQEFERHGVMSDVGSTNDHALDGARYLITTRAIKEPGVIITPLNI